MLKKLGEFAPHHIDSEYVRTADDIFEIGGPHGSHYCIAMQPQGCSLKALQKLFDKQQMPKELVMDYVQRLILCVNWLHVDCDILHGGKWLRRCFPCHIFASKI